MNDKREIWLDYLRAIACMLVVLLHTTAPYLDKIQTISLYSWQVGNFVDSFTRISVPLFFMISGYLFFGDKKPHFKNYIRIIISLFFYSAIALIYIKFYLNSPVWPKVRSIAFRPVFYHLWYFYTILVVYIFAYFFSVRTLKTNQIFFLFIVCFVILNPRLSHLTNLFDVTFKSVMQIDGNIVYYTLYAMFGSLLGSIKPKRYWFILYFAPLFFIISSILIGYSTFTISIREGKFIGTFYVYNGVLVAIGTISVFLFIKENANKLTIVKKPVDIIARNSLAIYGIHALILNYLEKEHYRNYDNPVLDIALVFVATFLLSIAISIIIKYFDKYKILT